MTSPTSGKDCPSGKSERAVRTLEAMVADYQEAIEAALEDLDRGQDRDAEDRLNRALLRNRDGSR